MSSFSKTGNDTFVQYHTLKAAISNLCISLGYFSSEIPSKGDWENTFLFQCLSNSGVNLCGVKNLPGEERRVEGRKEEVLVKGRMSFLD